MDYNYLGHCIPTCRLEKVNEKNLEIKENVPITVKINKKTKIKDVSYTGYIHNRAKLQLHKINAKVM